MKKVFTVIATALCALSTWAQNSVEQVDSVNAELDSIMKRWEIELGEVVVKSTLPTTQVKGDALRTTVAGTILEKAGSSTDMLNKLPMLSATRGEGVEVVGRGAAEVYINGRKVLDMNELDRLRADQIQSVDIIQNPGARYAASTRAVVRITLKKVQGEGFSFIDSFDLWHCYVATITNNLSVNYRTGGLDITASMWAGSYRDRSIQKNDLSFMVGEDFHFGASHQDQKYRWQGYSPQIQINYMINDKHSLGAFYKWDHNYKNDGGGYLATDIYEDGEIVERSMSDIALERSFKKHILSGYYNGQVGKLTIDFNFDALFNKNGEDNSTEETLTTDSGVSLHQVKNTSKATNKFGAAKLILSYPVWKGNLSVGGEYAYTHRTDTYSNVSTDVLPVKASDNVIDENMSSAFVEYGCRLGRVSLMAGVRYEHLSNDYYNFDVRQDEVCRNYGDFFPTLAISMPVGKTQMSLSYRKDINRPSYQELSSSTFYINHYTYQRGNPFLTPNYVHNLVYNLAYKWMNLYMCYSHDIDRVMLITEPFPGADTSISLLHGINSKEAFNNLDVQFSARPVIGKWHPMWSAGVHFQDYKILGMDGLMHNMNRPCASFNWNNDIELPWDLRLNAFVGFNTRGDYSNYRMTKCLLNTSLGLQRDFKLSNDMGCISIDLRVKDPFNIADNENIVMGVREVTSCRPGHATYSMNVTWKFNEAKKKYKGTGAGNSQKNRM